MSDPRHVEWERLANTGYNGGGFYTHLENELAEATLALLSEVRSLSAEVDRLREETALMLDEDPVRQGVRNHLLREENERLKAEAEKTTKWLVMISRDVRSAGDLPLVQLSEDGTTASALTLADELYLVAVTLDGGAAFAFNAEMETRENGG